MPQFFPLKVTEIVSETRDSVVVSLSPRAQDREKFVFKQGQYLTFRRDFDGTELRRSYSICSGEGAQGLRVGIKKHMGGAFSSWANDNLKVGDELNSMTPRGNFYVPTDPSASRHYLGFAGGSGITPLISMIYTVMEHEPNSRFTLVYSNSVSNAIMFKNELDDLKSRYIERIALLHVLGSENDLDLFSGRLDSQKCAQIFDGWVNIASVDHALICGPEGMMNTVSQALAKAGMSKDRIKLEMFGAPQVGRATQVVREVDNADTKQINVQITVDGVTRDIEMPLTKQSVLDAALEAGLDAPYSCKAGVCSTCRARVVSGKTEMIANHSLEEYEIERGYVLACQCYPLSDKVEVDFDS